MDDDSEPCAFCDTTRQVTWDPIHGWACGQCRWQQTYKMLEQPVTALPVRDEP